MARTLRLTGRYYLGAPLERVGLAEEVVELDADATALVALHCWNIGCPDGPAVDPRFRVGMGFPETLKAAYEVMRDRIRPAADAARRAGMVVAHVENDSIGRKHLGLMDTPPTVERGQIEGEIPPPAAAGHRRQIEARGHGEEFLTQSPYAFMDRVWFLMPEPGEPFAMDSLQLHRMLNRRGVQNLIYTGFAADMCLLRAPGGVVDMARRYSYRVFVIREATLGVEFPDWLDRRLATEYGLRQVEAEFGDTISWQEWMDQCARLAAS
jgi:nicotinamidase-related amidase